VIVAVVALVIVLALVAGGVFNSTSSNPATPTYSRAVGPANQAAAPVSGGPWQLVAAIGYDAPAALSVPTGSAAGANCTYTGAGSGTVPASLYVPAFHGSLSSGESPWWGMIYTQRATHQILLVQVLNGSAQAIAIGSGPCALPFQNFTTVPSNVVDSSVAASAAWSNGGSAFAAAHGSLNLSMEMGLIGGGSLGGLPIGAFWVIQLTPCGAFGTGGLSGSQPDFEAFVDAETGNVTFASATTTQCSSGSTSTPLGSVFAMGNPVLHAPSPTNVGCSSADYCYQVTIESVAGTLTPANLSFSVNTPSGSLVSGVRGFAILSASNLVVVSAFGNPSSPLWNSGTGTSTTPLAASMTIVADVGTANPAGAGDVLEAAGLGAFTGTVALGLP
jgi:hypothetical protein